MKIGIFRGTQIFMSNYNIQFFINHFIFRRQHAEFFLYKKIHQMKAGQDKIDLISPVEILQSPGAHRPMGSEFRRP